MTQLIRHIKPFAGYILAGIVFLILTVSSIPSIPTLKIKAGDSTIRLDYLIHICEYGFLTFISFLTFSEKDFNIGLKRSLVVVICLIIFAFADEFHQKFIPGRSYNIFDFVSNVTGIAGGWVFSSVVFRIVKKDQSL